MELRQYLDIVRRRAWSIVYAVVVVGLAAGIVSNLQTPQYESAARVLLRPDDPAERLNPDGGQRALRDPSRYVQSQRSIIESEEVIAEAVRSMGGGRAADIASQVSVRDGHKSDVLKIVGRDEDPARSRDVANAVALAYIENRRRSAVVGLERAVAEIEGELGPLQASIAELDAKIASAAGPGAAGGAPDPPSPPDGAATPPLPAFPQSLTPGGQTTSSEALKAVRYAAAVQYESLFRRLQELRIDISLKRGEAELISRARLPSSPVTPQPVRDTAAGAVVGLLLGVAVVVLREQLDDRLRSLPAVEQATGLPVLAQLPYDDETAARPGEFVAVTRPKAPLIEAVRALRTSVEYLSIDAPVRVVVVTSAAPGEGKSFVSANLAAVFADAGYRTLLLSADLRRPGISRLFDVPARSPGLTNVVVPVAAHTGAAANGARERINSEREPSWLGHTSFGPVAEVVRTPMRNLLFLPSGPVPPNPAELLASRRMTEVLNELRQKADVVVVDTPPLLPVTDAAVLAAKADGVVLVTAIGETRRSAAQRAKAILDGTQARLLGVVVNKVPRSSALYGYDGYYHDAEPKDRRRRRRRGKAVGGEGAGPSDERVGVPAHRRRRR